MRAPDTLPPEIERDLAAMDAAVAGRPHADGDPLLAELAALVAESRPEPDPEWARTLDVRQRQGFDKHAPFRPGRTRRPSRLARLRPPGGWAGPALGLAACALVALVVALPKGDGGEGSSGAGGGSVAASGDAAGSGAAREAAPP